MSWEDKAKQILKAEIKRHGLTYHALNQKLAENGIRYGEIALRTKINRGKFSFSFFLQCMFAMGAEQLYLGHHASRKDATSTFL